MLVNIKISMYVYMCVCMTFRTEQLGSQWKDFREIVCLSIFRKSVDKI